MRRIATHALFRLPILLGLLPMSLWAEKQPGFSHAEQALLQILLSDTTSHTVCYLSNGYKFGMTNQPDANFILLKTGSENYLVRDGSGKVFRIVKGENGPEIERMDSSDHVGHSFNSMAFFRKGRIHTYGGYGNWRNIDYFKVFDPAISDWKPLHSTNTLKNDHCYHFYDPDTDRFHALGSHFNEDDIAPNNIKSIDSVYLFDFKDSTWKTLGHLLPLKWKGMDKIWLMNNPTFITPYGLLEFNSGTVVLLDIPGNAIYGSKDDFFRFYRRIRESFGANFAYHSVVLHLRDTAFFIFGSADSIVVEKTRLTRAEFQTEPLWPIYEPVPTGLSAMLSKTRPYHPLSVGLLLLVLVITLARRWHGKVDGKVRETEWESDRPVKDQPPLVLTGRHEPIPASRFLDTLSEGERDLLKQLLESARKGETMDIESMNKILGVARKEEAVQKTRRSMAVSKINEAFRIGLRREAPLVERVRYENDKRKYRYRIAYEHVGTLDAAMKAKG
jgi:hypothetical protein